MKAKDKAKKLDLDRPHFSWRSSEAIEYLLETADLNPIRRTNQMQLRKNAPEGDYRLRYFDQWLELTIVPAGFGSFMIYTNMLRPVYKALRLAQEEIGKRYEKRDIIKPVLPESIMDKLQATVLDFFQAIDHFGSTKGFGNVGLILCGPAGVGKSETMRWLAEVGWQEYNRGYFKLSFAELRKILAEGVDMNNHKSLVMIDDIDASLLRDRRKEGANPLTAQFLTCLDGLDKREGRVIIVSTNEEVKDMDPALRRPGRFETVIKYDYPDADLIRTFCDQRELAIDPNRFDGWSFARIDMFISRFKVAEFMHNATMEGFYEKFIHEHGEIDETVEAYAEEPAID